ncbi:MAG: zinc ribbon domain-containing protein [Methanomassiliicoccales archaeon]|nr:MAG: zinc ribbon domain-containing protein [Methanomassiliicoccales archaeon]
MIKCRNCGNVFNESAKFCGFCGAQLYGPGGPWFVEKVEEKEPFLAILFSFILSGLGQIYCGRIARGLVILVISLIPTVLFTMLFLSLGDAPTFDDVSGWMTLMIVVGIVFFVFWIWQILDAYRLANEWNEKVSRTGSKPW